MGKLRGQLAAVRFHCAECDERFDRDPARIEDAPEDVFHPWRYFAPCPICATEAGQEKQQRHLLRMWASATGPNTPEGIAAVTKNLEGHPTPEEARRTRFNALRHGLTAKVATYFPAKPGKYPHCTGCEYLGGLCTEKAIACLKRTELYMRHHVAFEARDPELLREIRAEQHTLVTAIVEDMMRAVLIDGVRLKAPEWYYDKDGGFHLAKWVDENGREVQIEKLEAHPLLKPIKEFIASVGLSLPDQGMTPKVQEDADVVRGYLADQHDKSEASLEYQRRNTEALEGLRGLLERAADRNKNDPVLIEHERGSRDG